MENARICIIGLGYVGLPLAVAFAKKTHVVGYDINKSRVQGLQGGQDVTGEIESEKLTDALFKREVRGLKITNDVSEIGDSNIYIVTAPTPIDSSKRPDISLLLNAC